MNINRNTVLLILAVSLGSFILIFISSRFTISKIESETEQRKVRNALQEIIDATKNKHPVINETLTGKTVVINVWATWCGPCKQEIPDLNKLVKEFGNNQTVFIALNDNDSTEEVTIMQKQKIQFDYRLLFEQKKIIKLINSFAVTGERGSIPINLIINSEGKIQHFHVGNDTEKLQIMKSYLSAAANMMKKD